jgi:hypothetical protein
MRLYAQVLTKICILSIDSFSATAVNLYQSDTQQECSYVVKEVTPGVDGSRSYLTLTNPA